MRWNDDNSNNLLYSIRDEDRLNEIKSIEKLNDQKRFTYNR
jgi:hypothetical protein